MVSFAGTIIVVVSSSIMAGPSREKGERGTDSDLLHRKYGNRQKLWVFSQTGRVGYVRAPAAASLSFVAGVLPQALDDLV